MAYEYVTSARRYRDTATGRFVAEKTVWNYIISINEATGNATDALADLVVESRLSVDEYATQLRTELKDAYIQQYELGRGGRKNMRPADWGTVGRMLRDEYRDMEKFIQAIRNRELTAPQMRARARQYLDKSRQAYERANAMSHGIRKRLPSYPGDSHQTCHGGCRCRWYFEEVRDGDGKLTQINAYWLLDELAVHCIPTEDTRSCVQNANEYNPFVIDMRGET